MAATCGQCRFWVADPATQDYERYPYPTPERGECRRYPPAGLPPPGGGDPAAAGPAPGRFPLTACDDWCGELQPGR